MPFAFKRPLVSQVYSHLLMGQLGYSSRFIEAETGLSWGQISYRLRKAGVRRKDYRNGSSSLARRVLRVANDVAAKETRKQIKLMAG